MQSRSLFLVFLNLMSISFAADLLLVLSSAGATVGWRVADGGGPNSIVNPTLNVTFGDTIYFTINAGTVHPFAICTAPNTGRAGAPNLAVRYTSPDLTGPVPASLNQTVVLRISNVSASPLFYNCERHPAMSGRIVVVGINQTNSTASPYAPNNALVAHAVLMSISFCLLVPLGEGQLQCVLVLL